MQDLSALNEKIRERLMWSDTKLLRSLIVILDTLARVKRSQAPVTDINSDDDQVDEECSLAEVKMSVKHIVVHFRLPM